MSDQMVSADLEEEVNPEVEYYKNMYFEEVGKLRVGEVAGVIVALIAVVFGVLLLALMASAMIREIQEIWQEIL